MRPSSEESRPLRRRLISPGGCGLWLSGNSPPAIFGLGVPWPKHRADARLSESVQPRVGVLGRGVVVAPVEQGRHAAVQLVERAHQVRQIDVFGPKARAEPLVEVTNVLDQRPIPRYPAYPRLPGVLVGVHEPGQDDEPTRVEHFCPRGVDAPADLGDALALDQHVAAFDLSRRRVEREHAPPAQQCLLHNAPPTGGANSRSASSFHSIPMPGLSGRTR